MSLFLNLWNNDFPVHFHADEQSKVVKIKGQDQTFSHPILMIQMNRIVQAAVRSPDDFSIARTGRTLNGVLQAGSVILFFLLLSQRYASPWALAGAAAWAFSPIGVVHAHYLKEDVPLVFFLLATLLAMARWVTVPNLRRACILGALFGLAASSKYVGILVCLVLAAVILSSGSRMPFKRRLVQLGAMLLVALLVFLAVNYPLFADVESFLHDIGKEVGHMSEGYDYDVLFRPLEQAFTFHLRNSVIPGITPLAAILCLAGFVMLVSGWREGNRAGRVAVLYISLYYLVVEGSPVKPSPDFMRYVLPIVPGLIFCGLHLLYKTAGSRACRRNRWLGPLLAAGFVLVPLVESVRLTRHMEASGDTRTRAAAYVEAHDGKALSGAIQHHLKRLPLSSIEGGDTDFLLVDSFDYEKYLVGGQMKRQRPGIYLRSDIYRELFQRPYVEFKPAYKSFAFSNPTIRVFDLEDLR